jgi:hypothetical protein
MNFIPPTKVALFRDGTPVMLLSYPTAEQVAMELALNVNFWGCESRILNDTRFLGEMSVMFLPTLAELDAAIIEDGQEPVSFTA